MNLNLTSQPEVAQWPGGRYARSVLKGSYDQTAPTSDLVTELLIPIL